MAETLNLGTDGNWAVKKDSLLAYNSENRNFKPLPFSFSRASIATVVNKDGLIEIVGSGEPRIDFLNDSNGALLLEPQRTNLITYSQSVIDGWVESNIGIADNQAISPDGTFTSGHITSLSGSSYGTIRKAISVSANSTYTISLFVKKEVSETYYMGVGFVFSGGTTDVGYGIIDAVNGTGYSADPRIPFTIKVDDCGTYWRFSFTGTDSGSNNSLNAYIHSTLSKNGTSVTTGLGSTRTIWGIQLEAGSYATSYISTQGVISTRVAEVCSQTPPSGIIGQTEGTVYFEGSSDTIGGSTNLINFNFSANSVVINRQSTGVIRALINTASTILLDSSPVSGIFKVAIGYKNGDSVLYVNGTLAASSTNSFTFATALTQVNLGTGIAYFAAVNQSKCNQALLYNTRLTNAELQALTS